MTKPENQKHESIKSLIAELDSRDGEVRKKARKELVGMGSIVIDYLAELVETPSGTLRWEAVKAIGQIADPVAAPLLVVALQDSDFEVRWIATEGLIKMGTASVKPLLQALNERPDSLNLRESAHHVFHDLREKDAFDMLDIINLIMVALESPAAEDEVPVVAYRLLEEMQ